MTTTAKPKVDRTKYIIQDKTGETLTKHTGEIDGFNFKIRNLKDCTVHLFDWTNGMFIDDCINCKIITGPCDGSLFIRTSKNCTVSTLCKQLRFRDCHDVKIFTYCPSDPVVENSSQIAFGPFNVLFPGLKDLFVKAKFNPGENKYQSVYDFSEGKTVNEGAIHWELMKNEDFKLEEIPGEDGTACEPPYDDYLKEIDFFVKNDLNVKEKVDWGDEDESVKFSVNVNFDKKEQKDEKDEENKPEPESKPEVENPILKSDDIQVEEHTNLNRNTDFFNNTYTNTNTYQETPQNFYDFNNNTPNNINISQNNLDFEQDDEQSKPLRQRQIEHENRQKAIRAKMEEELKMKNEFRNKARDFIENFNLQRDKIRDANRKKNLLAEENLLEERKNNSTKNPWAKVIDLVEIRESNYKGTKKVDRMRQMIISRKQDYDKGITSAMDNANCFGLGMGMGMKQLK